MSDLMQTITTQVGEALKNGVVLQCIRTPDGILRPPLSVSVRAGPFTIPQLKSMGVKLTVLDDAGNAMSDDDLAQAILQANPPQQGEDHDEDHPKLSDGEHPSSA